MNHILVFCANHTSLKKFFVSADCFSGSSAPSITIEKLVPMFNSATIFYQHKISFQKIEVINLQKKVKINFVKVSQNRIISFFQMLIYGFMFSLINLKKKRYYYGMGYFSIISFFLGKIFKSVTVARFFGTFLGEHIKSGKFIFNSMPLKRLVEYFAMSLKHKLIIITNDGTNSYIVRDILHPQSERVQILFNGFDEKKTKSSSFSIMAKEIKNQNISIFTSVSRLSNWKRIDLVIDFFTEINKKHKTFLFIVGFGDSYQKLKEYAISKGLRDEKDFLFTNGLTQPEALAILKESDYFLSFYDVGNVGNTLIEALNMNCIPIVRNTGSTEAVISKEMGIILDKNEAVFKEQIRSFELISDRRSEQLLINIHDFLNKNIFSWDERILKEYNLITKTK